MTQAEVDGWWRNQQCALEEKRFFAAASYYTFVAKRAGEDDK